MAVTTLSTVAQTKNVELKDIWWFYRFYPKGVSGLHSMSDGTHYTTLEKDKSGWAIVKFAYATGDVMDTVLTRSTLEKLTGESINIDAYDFNNDESQLLLATETEPIYRHSSKSVFYHYELGSSKIEKLSEGKQMYASFHPGGKMIAFVRDNDLYIKDLGSNTEKAVTTDGEKNKIINGALDWVYEEEFSFDQAFYWSPDGNYIAFYRFDETEVPEFSMDIYGKDLYPTQYVFKYPKAGEPNSKVTAHIYDVKDEKTIQVLNDIQYEYIPRIKWTQKDDQVVVYTMNRLQNELNLWKVNASTGQAELWMKETDPAYIEINDDIRFLKDGSIIWTSDRDGYQHIYHISGSGKVMKQITEGKWDVTEFYGIDEENGWLYYQSAEVHPTQRHVYRINLKGKKKTNLTPDLGWNTANFSQGFKYFIHEHSAANSVPTTVLRDSEGESIRELEMNEDLRATLDEYQISKKEFMTIPNGDGVEMNAWMIKPVDFDKDKAYPVLMFVYGGPGSQTVENSYDGFNDKYYQILADKGYIIVSVDNRGTGARGRDFRKVTYKELGKYETEDQIAAAKWLADQKYVDGNRIGIWGWSYGGYMSSLCITKGADVFKAAIAVAPVTNWRFYDNIYTERYMQTPEQNASGYDDNSPINHVKKLKGSYLLVHGSADDNVHVQNTMRMIDALVNANKQFDLFIYPDKNHGIYGGNTRYHLYDKMTRFLEDNL